MQNKSMEKYKMMAYYLFLNATSLLFSSRLEIALPTGNNEMYLLLLTLVMSTLQTNNLTLVCIHWSVTL